MNILSPSDCIFSDGLVWFLMLQSVREVLLSINTKFQLNQIKNGKSKLLRLGFKIKVVTK